jgi:hypothetical protein
MGTSGEHPQARGLPRRVILLAIIPSAIYFTVFLVVTYPLIVQFSTHFFTDDKDGLVMVWNVWWTDTALTKLHQSPWHTNYLYHPYGVSLYAHTLCPFNGLLAIVLLPFLTLIQAYNSIVIFTFVVAGLTTFWLAFFVVRSYWPSVVAGFIFSFSNYHFAHMPGHLNLASLEWLPLFVLCWYVLMRNPSVLVAVASAVSLFLVVLCDYYYFVYCFVIAVALFFWRALKQLDVFFFLKARYLVPLLAFVAAASGSSGIIMFKLLRTIESESLVGAHDPSEFATDALSPFIYGPCLRFSHLTKPFWSNLPGNTSEKGIYMGISVLVLITYAWLRRRRVEAPSFRVWCAMTLFFFLTSMGPTLQVWGQYVPFGLMPYRLLEVIFPWIKVSGVPSRMMVIVMLFAAVISAVGLDLLLRTSKRSRLVAIALVAILFAEYLPQKLPTFNGKIPDWVSVLTELPGRGGVIDARGDPYTAMYFQTVHHKPILGGVVARVPQSLKERNNQINQCVTDRDSKTLREHFEFDYAVTGYGEIYDLSRGAVVYQPR